MIQSGGWASIGNPRGPSVLSAEVYRLPVACEALTVRDCGWLFHERS